MGGGSKTSTGIQFWSTWSLYIYGIAKNLFKEQFYHVHGKYVLVFFPSIFCYAKPYVLISPYPGMILHWCCNFVLQIWRTSDCVAVFIKKKLISYIYWRKNIWLEMWIEKRSPFVWKRREEERKAIEKKKITLENHPTLEHFHCPARRKYLSSLTF